MDLFDLILSIVVIWLAIDVAVVAILVAAARRREEPVPQPARAVRQPSLRFARSRAEAERTRA